VRDTVILGCGYTGDRVARRLLAVGVRVVATSPRAGDLGDLAALGADIVRVDARDAETLTSLGALARGRDVAVLCCVPPLAVEGGVVDATASLLAPLAPARVVYLSTASVYGDAQAVDATTPARPKSASDLARLAAERGVLDGPWSGMVLRPGAIYGPSRGIHTGAPLRRAIDPDRLVSRIHVDDLAALCVAALAREDVNGAWPVADEHPATPAEIAAFCASIGIVTAPFGGDIERHESASHGRRVDGRAVLLALGVTLAYRSFRGGIPASLHE
jgi:nucleoside-diphosphate-sugar epimerase